MARASSKPRVCIVGAGFAGLNAAQQLKASRYEVTIIDPALYIEWLPNIHEIISGVKTGDELRLSRQRIIERLGHCFIRQKVVGLNAAAATLEDGQIVPFDACVVSTGGTYNDFNIHGVSDYALPTKSVEDCQRIAKKLRLAALGHKTTRVTVVGGGIEGVEFLGEALRAYRNRPQFEFSLIDSKPKVLAECAGNLDRQIKAHTSSLNVDFSLGQRVASVEKEGVYLESGKAIESDITIWSGGLAPNKLLYESRLAETPNEWGHVNRAFQSRHYENVFVIGDAAQYPLALSKQAFHAIDMGKFAAHNIERYLKGQALKQFEPGAKPQVVTFGDLDTFMVFNGFSVSSSVLGAAKEAVYTLGLLQLSPPQNAKEAVRSLDLFQKSVRRVYLPSMNPLNLASKLPKVKFMRG